MIFTTALKKQKLRSWITVAVYLAIWNATLRYVHHHHPKGAALYVCAALPWTAMCGGIVSIALYLHQEQDGNSRERAMRIMLCGAGAAMAVNFFLNFLRTFGWKGQPPVFLELYVFAGTTAAASLAYVIAGVARRKKESLR